MNKVKNMGLMILVTLIVMLPQSSLAQQGDVFKLDEYIVTATKTEHTLGDVPVYAKVITREEIEARNVKTVQDALKYLTGIKVNQTSGTWGDMGKVVIQGLNEKHTLILLDGQRISGGHGSAVDLQQISTAMVERIEIVQGPASALYGSDAVGGVINIITKSPPEKPTISASASLGTRKTQIYELNGGFTQGQFGSSVNYTHRQSDGVNAETDEYRELGAEYQFLKIFLGKLNFFRNDIEDLIDSRIVRRGPPPWDMYWENVDEAYTQGVELSVASQIMENLTGRAGYTFLDTEDKETKKELPHRAKNTIVAELDWKISEIDLNLNLTGKYVGKRYEDEANTEKLGGYTIFDLALTKYIGDNLRLFARVDNVFNKKNVRDEYDIDGTEFLGGVEVKF